MRTATSRERWYSQDKTTYSPAKNEKLHSEINKSQALWKKSKISSQNRELLFYRAAAIALISAVLFLLSANQEVYVVLFSMTSHPLKPRTPASPKASVVTSQHLPAKISISFDDRRRQFFGFSELSPQMCFASRNLEPHSSVLFDRGLRMGLRCSGDSPIKDNL